MLSISKSCADRAWLQCLLQKGGLLCTPIKYLKIIYLKDSTNIYTTNESSEIWMFIWRYYLRVVYLQMPSVKLESELKYPYITRVYIYTPLGNFCAFSYDGIKHCIERSWIFIRFVKSQIPFLDSFFIMGSPLSPRVKECIFYQQYAHEDQHGGQ